jgi:hypothetical protein
MVLRLIFGLVKGLVLGGLLGYGLAAAGFAVPGAIVAYLGVAVVGLLVACIAGKPIWAKGARIEVGMKAVAAALLAPALLYAVRRWITPGLPFDPAVMGLEGAGASLGTFAVTSYAIVAAVLGGFFDADNDPSEGKEEAPGKAKAPKKRIEAAAAKQAEPLAEADEAVDVKRRRAGK